MGFRDHLGVEIAHSCAFALRRHYILSVAVLVTCCLALVQFYPPWGTSSKLTGTPSYTHTVSNKYKFNGTWDFRRDEKNYHLDDVQCQQAFPGLFDEVDRAVEARRNRIISFEELESIPRINGYVRGMIYDQELYIIATEGKIYSREFATLHSLHRALLTSVDPLPNVEFTFISDDRIGSQATWTYARRAEDTALWLIPDFGYWAWPETKVGSYGEVHLKAQLAETQKSESWKGGLPPGGGWTWDRKHSKLVWRGATMDLEVREKFINATRDKDWADVRTVTWHNEDSMRDDLLSMDAHCAYKFLGHVEGNSYSGRLKYLQNCRSVIVAHTLDWIQHYQPLMRSSGSEQNYVEVSRDFSDLESTIKMLLTTPNKAETIAGNSVVTFRERYLTPAAETCYWRRLVRGWKEVTFEPQFWNQTTEAWRGVPWESFALEGRLEWDPY